LNSLPEQFSQADVEVLNDFENYLSFIPTWMYRVLVNLPHKIIFTNSGNQCIDGDTLIYDPILKGKRKVRDIKGSFHVKAWDGTKLITSIAEQPFRKEIDELYTIKLSNGQEFVASLSHRVLTSDGYRHLGELPEGCEIFLPLSNSESSPSVHGSGGDRWFGRRSDLTAYYLLCHHLRGEQPLSCQGIDPTFFPSQADALEHMGCHSYVYTDDLENKSNNSRIYLRNDHLPSLDVQNPTLGHAFDSLCQMFYTSMKPFYRKLQVSSQSLYASIRQFLPTSSSTSQAKRIDNQSSSCITSVMVTSITHKKRDYKWDFTVPKYHNYQLAGIIHHNSMKTASVAHQYVDRILGWHPVPKKNVVYWECSVRAKIHRNEILEDELLLNHKNKDSATWNSLQRPEDMKCPECGAEIIEHKRGSRTFRFGSETLPGESGNVAKDGTSA